ncbi:hypothetical protein FB45DRAFT_827354 [Roridomyces roridus]|uniref:CCHC-type domain-containing protein n=1 Tax=Roridomyces roridus TaxID=1738132 RepID=A0AAD7C4P0_9AGAR|nr:hypothetical protein FB45DRAFT_827354 [Roridomyces roridus]
MPDIIDLTREQSLPPIAVVSPEARDEKRRDEGGEQRRKPRGERERVEQRDKGHRDREHKRPRESSRERDSEGKRRKKDRGSSSRSRKEGERKHRRKDREPSRERDHDRKDRRHDGSPLPKEQLFFLDDKPAQLPAEARYTPAQAQEEALRDLILPAHVSVFGETPAEIPVAESDSDGEEDYIEYLDYDNRKDFVRYYEEEKQEKRVKIVCKKCGEEGDHMARDCTVLICLTCGARDDHPTARCDISKTCFSCGMKGHINSNCPNRGAGLHLGRDGCDRCQSSNHQTSECPSLWRIYVYVQPEDRERVLQERKGKQGLRLGQGGEGYIADDEWCYNCGSAGHWGDDCEHYHQDQLADRTAFSYDVLSTGPFPPPKPGSGNRVPREWERDVPLPGGVEKVGRRGKKKEMEKLSRRAEQLEDAADDWFEKAQSRRDRPTPTEPRKMALAKPAARSFQFGEPKVSLADRLSDAVPDKPRKERREHKHHSGSKNRDERRGRDDRGPRYKGGYAR